MRTMALEPRNAMYDDHPAPWAPLGYLRFEGQDSHKALKKPEGARRESARAPGRKFNGRREC